MTTSNSRMAYDDCFALLEQARKVSRGIKIKCPTHGAAQYLKVRLNTARRIDRNDNAGIYPEDHPMHGRSIYDGISCKIRDSAVILERLDTRVYDITELEED